MLTPQQLESHERLLEYIKSKIEDLKVPKTEVDEHTCPDHTDVT